MKAVQKMEKSNNLKKSNANKLFFLILIGIMSTSLAFAMESDDEDKVTSTSLLHQQGQEKIEKIWKLHIFKIHDSLPFFKPRKHEINNGKMLKVDVHHSSKDSENYRAYNQMVYKLQSEKLELIEQQREDFRRQNLLLEKALKKALPRKSQEQYTSSESEGEKWY